MQDVLFSPLRELEEKNQEFREKIDSLAEQFQSFFEDGKIDELEKSNLEDEVDSLQDIYSYSLRELNLLSIKLSDEISASRQSLIDASRWSQEEGWAAFQDPEEQ